MIIEDFNHNEKESKNNIVYSTCWIISSEFFDFSNKYLSWYKIDLVWNSSKACADSNSLIIHSLIAILINSDLEGYIFFLPVSFLIALK